MSQRHVVVCGCCSAARKQGKGEATAADWWREGELVATENCGVPVVPRGSGNKMAAIEFSRFVR
jgi:hypothetical protein